MRSRLSRPRALLVAALVPGLMLAVTVPATASPGGASKPVPVPKEWSGVAPGKPGIVAPALRGKHGTVRVSVALSQEPVAAAVPQDAVPEQNLPSKAQQRATTAKVEAQQDTMIGRAKSLGAKTLGRATKAVNVVAMTVPSDRIDDLAALPGVVSVKPIATYTTDEGEDPSGSLEQAADYVQATQVRQAGYDGTGVRVAVLDSGIDFTHRNLGGPGTTAAYDTCYAQHDVAPSGDCAKLFGPNAPKVKGGYDFVGETWPNTAEKPDPNPIDAEGHGTHVSDIIGGRSAGGKHTGIAPGVSLYGVRVCSAVATSCSGVAMLQGLDWALDPNGDGDISDAVDIVNMSLGSSYGQEQDDSSAAVDNLVRAGVVAVISAGNSADRPFIVGSPSTAAGAISVAQTALPDDKLYVLAVDPGDDVRNAKLQTWSPAPTSTVTGRIAQPSGDLLGCTAASFSGFPAGAVALIKRGTCNASAKAQNAQAAGAAAVVIWNNVPGDPPDFSFGGGAEVTKPTFTISYADGTRLSAAAAAGAVTMTIDPAATSSLANTVVGTSSRGLAISGYRAKPDIGAPGAWLSAEVGTGAEETNFGGTSGAAPVVSGAAALLLDKFPDASPRVVKARLINGADTGNKTPGPDGDLYPTPIARVGAGEVRVAPAANAAGVLRTAGAGGNIGLGLPRLTSTKTYRADLKLTNTGKKAKTYRLTPGFRDPADAATRAVTVKTARSVWVPGRTTVKVPVRVTINPSRLADWPFVDVAGQTGDGSALNGPEFDGYLTATAGSGSSAEKLSVGWTVLPRKAADVSAESRSTGREVAAAAGQAARQSVILTNASRVADGPVQVFGLTGTSPKLPQPGPGQPGSPGSNQAVIDLAAAGVRDLKIPGTTGSQNLVQFAVAAHQRYAVPLYPMEYDVYVDTNRDGTDDYVLYSAEAGGFAATGTSVVNVVNLKTGAGAAYYYNVSDFDSATQVLTAPWSALGLTAGATFDFSVYAFDNYFSGVNTDAIEGQSWTPGATRYAAAAAEATVPAGRRLNLPVISTPAVSSSQTGLLFLYGTAKKHDFQAVPLGGR